MYRELKLIAFLSQFGLSYLLLSVNFLLFLLQSLSYKIYLNSFATIMRPQSAKPGHKGYWGHSSAQQVNDQSVISKGQRRVKLMKPDLTTHDFARIMPKRIHQDKERLYSQALQLKQNLNQTIEQNIRLKTKISILQKQKDKMNRFIQTTPEPTNNKNNSRINIYGGKSQKDNMIVRNLKKIVREMREERDMAKNQNYKIKKMMKYTKINQLQIEKKIVIDQNRRLSSLLQEYSDRVQNQEQYQRQIEQLKRYLQQQMQNNKQLSQDNEKQAEIIQQLQQKLRSINEKHMNRQKKIMRELAAEKKKTLQNQKHIQDLRRELKNIKQSNSFVDMKKKQLKPVIRNHPISNVSQKLKTQQSNFSKNEANQESNKKESQVKLKNEQLLKELKQIKIKLELSENQLKKIYKKQKSQRSINIKKSQKIQKQSQFSERNGSKAHEEQKQEKQIEKLDLSSGIQKYEQTLIEHSGSPQQLQDYEENYEDQYTEEFAKLNDSKLGQNQKEEQQLKKIKKEIQQSQEEEELYKKEPEEKKIKKKNNQEKKKDTQKKIDKKKTDVYKPDKKKLAQIKELLTYRMKSQRYPFQDLKGDIESAQTTKFAYQDLCDMLTSEPFYLTTDYTKIFLKYCFQKQSIKPNQVLDNAIFLQKLRKVIDDFSLMEENEQKQMIIRIAEMTSTYPQQLNQAFQNIKNGQETVAKPKLIEMFQKLELEDKYIELIISQLSLCSDDIEHLNFHGFFQRFYVEDEDEYIDNNAIEEQRQESEDSYKNSSRVKKSGKSSSNKQIGSNKLNQLKQDQDLYEPKDHN